MSPALPARHGRVGGGGHRGCAYRASLGRASIAGRGHRYPREACGPGGATFRSWTGLFVPAETRRYCQWGLLVSFGWSAATSVVSWEGRSRRLPGVPDAAPRKSIVDRRAVRACASKERQRPLEKLPRGRARRLEDAGRARAPPEAWMF